MFKNILILACFSCMFFVGCSPKVDASGTEARFYDSVEKVRLSLPQEKQQKFMDSVTYLLKQHVLAGTASLATSAPLQLSQTEAAARNAVHGKTGEQIIEEARLAGLK